ncbi:hypothetical protein BpHYR1_028000 [Brachionus plicatilis]|uniref:Uncharacterized protein n=1 Tax=Brachionus plicatilis TaxID=10195 RepID=A0A3M7RL66_BRAPC|nr:hypothetical protein BpHYR1_028000 [Brachionus plicatilis]
MKPIVPRELEKKKKKRIRRGKKQKKKRIEKEPRPCDESIDHRTLFLVDLIKLLANFQKQSNYWFFCFKIFKQHFVNKKNIRFNLINVFLDDIPKLAYLLSRMKAYDNPLNAEVRFDTISVYSSC